MYINSHTHIFNLKSIFTEETVEILIKRVLNEFKFLNEKKELKEQLVNFLTKLVRDRFTDKVDFKSVLKELGVEDKDVYKFERFGIDFSIEGDIINILEQTILKNLSKENAIKDAQKQDFKDYMRFILISLVDSIDKMCLELIKSMDKDDGAVVLMMDITNGQEDDKELFIKQAKNTAAQVLKYPGRIFPFYALNPKRNNHYELMEYFFKDYPFVGLKLYPSLGYKIDSDEIAKVVDFCDNKNIPILQHCNQGGFYADKEYIEYSNPDKWEPYLQKKNNFKICFGHFGGDENFLNKNGIDRYSWSAKILKLMETYPGRVFADISFHTYCMDSGEKQENYFKNLKSLLDDEKYSPYILWGSDFFLINSRISNENYRIYFQNFLKENNYFEKIAKENPKRFLDLDNLGENFFAYIKRNINNIGEAAEWLLKKEDLDISPLGSKWSRNNPAHTSLHKFLLDEELFSTVTYSEAKDFDKTGKLNLDRLKYHINDAPEDIKEAQRESFAKEIIIYFKDLAEFEESYSRNKAKKELMEFLKNGDLTISDLGEEIDKIFKFKGEK